MVAISRLSSGETLSSQRSSPDIRMPTTKSGPTASRIASSTSSEKRTRFLVLPPYSSVRWLVAGDQNWSGRWPPESSSTPSRPPSFARRAPAA